MAREKCEDFAPRNGAARASEERGANRALEKPAGGSRRRGTCVKILLPETEPQGLARSGEQTAPWKNRPPGLQPTARRAYHQACKHTHLARPTPKRARDHTKNAGRQPGVSPYPLIRLFIPADSGRFPRILPGTLSAVEALLRCPLRGWLPHSAEAPDRAGTSAGGTNRCDRSDRN